MFHEGTPPAVFSGQWRSFLALDSGAGGLRAALPIDCRGGAQRRVAGEDPGICLGPPVVPFYQIDHRKKGYPFSNLSTGGPSCGAGVSHFQVVGGFKHHMSPIRGEFPLVECLRCVPKVPTVQVREHGQRFSSYWFTVVYYGFVVDYGSFCFSRLKASTVYSLFGSFKHHLAPKVSCSW